MTTAILGRWRQTQVWLDKDYEWLMPPRYQHMFSEGANTIYPLFVVFAETPERIKRGLQGACLPFVTQAQALKSVIEEEIGGAGEMGSMGAGERGR